MRRFVLASPHPSVALSSTSMPIQAISWSPSGAVRIIDQRALPEAEITRDLESAEAVAEAIRQVHVRGAPLIRLAAALGLPAPTPHQPTLAPSGLVARANEGAAPLGASPPAPRAPR